ncbi:MAG TPA: hypothetical protein VI796_05095 [Candidatus Thermoplasmatota archaeon]|nr:hypothetical protein [Candidatus Thermoplasmatota archaeon]
MDLRSLPVFLACLLTTIVFAGCSGDGSGDSAGSGSSEGDCYETLNTANMPGGYGNTKVASVGCGDGSGSGTDAKTVTGCSSASNRVAAFTNDVEAGSVHVTITDGSGEVLLDETLSPGGENGQYSGDLPGDRFTLKGVRSASFEGGYTLTVTCNFLT